MIPEKIVDQVLQWYSIHARDLPWRDGQTDAWGILVSEVMLQQTPVARVEPIWREWMQRWGTPEKLAAASPADVITAWGRLGYPRRALRLRDCAAAIRDDFAGRVPATYDELITLPGIGDYTAAAVASFAYGARHTVIDTNVRRILARIALGEALPGRSLSAAERALANEFVPEAERAPAWAVASMELGAIVCTARSPQCLICPVAQDCRWLAAGKPPPAEQPKGQSWVGSDRQVRGRIMAVLRESEVAVALVEVHKQLSDVQPGQRERCLNSLLRDGLAVRDGDLLDLPR